MLSSWLPRYTIALSVIPPLRRNTTTINRSNLRNFLAYIINNVSLFNPTLAGATVLTLRMQQARQNSNTNFITAMVSGKYWPTKELKMKQSFTCVWWTWLRQILEKSMTLPVFENDKNGMTLQSKIFFLKRQMSMRIIWDRKNFSKSGWGPKHWGTFSQCPSAKCKCFHLASKALLRTRRQMLFGK